MDRSEYNKEWNKAHPDYQNEWHKANPNYKKEYNKEYYQENIQRIAEWQSLKIKCVCGSTIRRGNKARHEKTNKHILYFINN